MEVRVVLHYVSYEGTPNEKYFSRETKEMKEKISLTEDLFFKQE